MNEVKDACNTTFEEYYYGKNGLRELSEKQIQDYEKMKRREKDLGN